MESTKSKPKKIKNFTLKPKLKPTADEIDDTEAQLLSPVERVKISHLATTPITPGGNIVDMQGSLNQATPNKAEDDKSDKTNLSKNETMKNDSNKECSTVESKIDSETKPSEGGNDLPSPSVESKSIVGQIETNPVTDPSSKPSVPENQGRFEIDFFFLLNL